MVAKPLATTGVLAPSKVLEGLEPSSFNCATEERSGKAG